MISKSSSWTKLALIVLTCLNLGLNLGVAKAAATEPDEQTTVKSEPDPDSKVQAKVVDAFPGKGNVDNTGVPEPGKVEINLSLSRVRAGDMKSLTATTEVNYGLEFYRDMQIGCAIPYTTETGRNDDGLEYRSSGGGSIECNVKVLFYNNDKTGVSASAGINYQKARNIIFHNFEGNDIYNHVVVPLVIQKDINDGKISLVGTVSVDHTINAGPEIDRKNQVTYGVGAGYRINNDSSISVDATKTIQGVAWVDVTYMRKSKALSAALSSDTYGYISVGKSSNGSYADSNQKVVRFGLQINPKKSYGENGGIFHAIKEAQDNKAAADAEEAERTKK